MNPETDATIVGLSITYRPMSQGTYFEINEWELPPEKDPEEPGYFVRFNNYHMEKWFVAADLDRMIENGEVVVAE